LELVKFYYWREEPIIGFIKGTQLLTQGKEVLIIIIKQETKDAEY